MRVVRLMGIFALGLAASCSAPPDELAFAQHAVRYVLDGATLSRDKVIVLDSENLRSLPPEMRAELVTRMEEQGLSWMELDIQENVEQLPGRWEETTSIGRLSRVNRTHDLLSIEVSGEGGTRELRWSRRCGPLCGGAGEAVFRWHDKEWNHEKVLTAIY